MTFRNTKWKTKDGRILRVRDMETSHIINCLHMMETVTKKQAETGIIDASGASFWLQGEAASACANAIIDRLEGVLDNPFEWLMDHSQQYRSMVKELEFRKAWPLEKERSIGGWNGQD